MESILEIKKVSKLYNNRKIIDNVDMNVKKGEIYGFLGPNGAGKSTLMKMILNLVKGDKGEILLFGQNIKENLEPLKRIGSIIENPYFYDKLTGKENLELHCEYMGYYNKKSIEEVIELIGLKKDQKQLVCNYSLGMKQRLAIGRAIITNPELLILDEPINGLDPEGIMEIRSIIENLNKKYGVTIFISSHILSEIELIADRIGIIKDGEILKEISMKSIHEFNSEYIEIESKDLDKIGYCLEEKLNITNYKIVDKNIMRIYDFSNAQSIISKELINNNIELESICKKTNSLEEYYMDLVRRNKDASFN